MNRFATIIIGLVACMTLQGCSKPADTARLESCSVVITRVADGRQIAAIKAVREATNLGLKDAKDLVDGIPSAVKKGLSKAEADALASKLRESGLEVEVRRE